MRSRAGDWVEVRSKEEILKTLDKNGRMEGLPFMPQMFQYCGQRFKVFKRAHKTCDWVYTIAGRRVSNGVHLEFRCDGEAYEGCQSACLIFWKEAWLKPVTEARRPVEQSLVDVSPDNNQIINESCCTEADVLAGTRVENEQHAAEPRYVCQGTEVLNFTTPLPWWDVRQYLEDYTSGNVTLGRLVRGFIYAGYTMVLRSGIGLGRPMRWVYDTVQSLWGGIPHPRRVGYIPAGQSTPTSALNLQPGELVRVKSFKEILATIDTEGKNRGLRFDAEQVPYCGSVYPVRTRVTKYIDEKTGKPSTLKSAAIILEGATCQSRYSYCRMFCPRSIYPWFREIWLERVPENNQATARPGAEKNTPGQRV